MKVRKKLPSKDEDIALTFLIIIVIGASFGIFTENLEYQVSDVVVGHGSETSESSVTIQNYISIAKSDDLNEGIQFGTINVIPANYSNATANYNDTETGYNITVAEESNVAVDFCIIANDSLADDDGGNYINITNMTWTNATSNDVDNPIHQEQSLSMNTTYCNASTSVSVGSDIYFRFWLNVTEGQEPDTYINTITITGVPTGDKCDA